MAPCLSRGGKDSFSGLVSGFTVPGLSVLGLRLCQGTAESQYNALIRTWASKVCRI